MALSKIEQDFLNKSKGVTDQAIASGLLGEAKGAALKEYDPFISGLQNLGDIRPLKIGSTVDIGSSGFKLQVGETPQASHGVRWKTFSVVDPTGKSLGSVKHQSGMGGMGLTNALRGQFAGSQGINPAFLQGGVGNFGQVTDILADINKRAGTTAQALERQAPGTGGIGVVNPNAAEAFTQATGGFQGVNFADTIKPKAETFDPKTGQVTAGIPQAGQFSGNQQTAIDPTLARQVRNEGELGDYRKLLGSMGIPQTEWNKYISSPDAQGRIFFTPPRPAGGANDQAGTVTEPTPPAGDISMTADGMADTQEDIALPGVEPGADISGSVVGGAEQASKNLEETMAELATPETKDEKEFDVVSQKLSELMEETADRAIAQIDANEELKIPQMRSDYKALNTKILSTLEQYNMLRQDIEGKPITMSSIIGAQAQVEKKKLAELGWYQAQATGLLGQIEEAQAQANASVDAEYSTMDTRIKIYEAQLNILADKIDKKDSKVLQAQNLMLQREKERVEEEKGVKKAVKNMALQAQQNGADDRLVDMISNAKTEIEAAKIAGVILDSGGWAYVDTIAKRDALIKEGYEIEKTGGRTYARKESPELAERRAIKELDAEFKTPTGGSGKVQTFKFSSDDRGRLLAVNFTADDIRNIQDDINQFGMEQTVAGMSEEQANAVRNITRGVTPTQERAEGEPEKISEGKRKAIGGVNALISDNASNEEIEEYIKLKGYTKEDFSDLLKDYTPTVSSAKWWEFWK